MKSEHSGGWKQQGNDVKDCRQRTDFSTSIYLCNQAQVHKQGKNVHGVDIKVAELSSAVSDLEQLLRLQQVSNRLGWSQGVG